MRQPPLAGNNNGWRAQAQCLGSDPDLFFPLGGTGEPLAQAESAKRVCEECEVRDVCRQFALETNQVTGVWGGTTEDERKSVRRTWLRAGRPALVT